MKIGEEKAEEIKQNMKIKKGGDRKMMAVFETIEEDNKRIFMRGIKEGKKEGKIEGKKEAIGYIKNMI